MGRNDNLTQMLELFTQPSFLVQDGIIVNVNQAAVHLAIPVGSAIEDIITGDPEIYRQYNGGQLHIQLQLLGIPYGATVNRIGETDVFIFDHDQTDSNLQALALAAQQLRTPLADVVVVTEKVLSSQAGTDETDVKNQAVLHRALYQMMRTLNNMSDAANFSCSNTDAMEAQDLSSLVAEIISKITATAQETGITLNYQGPADRIITMVDKDKLERAIYNLIANAIKFSPANAQIDITLCQKNKTVYFSVLDRGIDYPIDQRKDLYERFLRAPSVEDVRNGMGLGMLIVRAAAAAHGGTVLAEKIANTGTKFTMTIPIQERNGSKLRSNILRVDYAGGMDRTLIELSDVLPIECFYE